MRSPLIQKVMAFVRNNCTYTQWFPSVENNLVAAKEMLSIAEIVEIPLD